MQVTDIRPDMDGAGELRSYRYDQGQFFCRVTVESDWADDIERRFVSLDLGLTDEEVAAAMAERLRTRTNQDGVGVLSPHPWAIRKLGDKAARLLVERRLTLASADELNDLRLLFVDYVELRSLRRRNVEQYEEILKEKARANRLDERLSEAVIAAAGLCKDCRRVRYSAGG
jgi:hypothetical protein